MSWSDPTSARSSLERHFSELGEFVFGHTRNMAAPRPTPSTIRETTASGERPRVRNRRALNRIVVRISATLAWDGVEHQALITDLGMGGAFVECRAIPPFACAVTLAFSHWTGPLRVPATIRWNGDRGVGMQFGLLSARETYAVAEVLQQLGAVPK